MPTNPEAELLFKNPPIYETSLAVQYEPIAQMRATFVGEFYSNCLKSNGWYPLDELDRLPYVQESVEDKFIGSEMEPDRVINSIGFRTVFANDDLHAKFHVQADRLMLQKHRSEDRSTYREISDLFSDLFDRFQEFVKTANLSVVSPNFWDVIYSNVIQSELAGDPSQWWRILPGLYSETKPSIEDHPWTTFDGTWYFLLPNNMGRLRAKVQKILPNPPDDYGIYFILKASGKAGYSDESSWLKGLNAGHDSILKAFLTLSSPEIRKKWEEMK